MTGLELPPGFVRNVLAVRGEDAGRAFLASLPAIIGRCRDQWGLAVGEPFAALTYNWAAPVTTRDGEAAVLKIATIEGDELAAEVGALRLFDGRGAVRLLAFEPADGAMLLERALPGTSLLDVDNDQATRAVGVLMSRLLRHPLPPDHPFPTLGGWARAFERLRAAHGGGTGPMPAGLVERAEGIFRDFLAEGWQPVLLHGDLHHTNVLAAAREPWLAIDPHGVAGDPAFEPAAFLRNPLDLTERLGASAVVRRRLDILADEFGYDRERVRLWAIANCVLSAAWSVEDGGEVPQGPIETARILHELG